MAITLDGTTGITTPGLTNTGTETIVNLTTTGNTTLGDATTDTLTVGVTGIVKDASGNVGIGTASPAFKLEIVGGTNNGVHLKDAASATVYGGLFTQSANLALVTRSNHALTFGTNDTERMRVNAGAPILCLSGGSTTATGTGIAFPATQSASSDANTLDDYEEGTWTPATVPSVSGTVTLKNINAYYTKVGRLVNVWFTAQVNTVSSPNGRLGLTGLPFAANSSPIGATCLINGFSVFSGSTGALIESGTTGNMDIYINGSISSNLANYAAANGYIFFNATYTT